MAVIDLGRVDHGADPPATSRPRPLGRPGWRRLLVAAVAVCCVLTVTGSARPDPPGLVQLWDVPFTLGADSYQLSGDAVFLLGHSVGWQLTAHDARTGAVRWSIEAGESAGLAGAGAGALLLRAGLTVVNRVQPDDALLSREFSRATVAVDTATGRRLWRQPGEVMTIVNGHALLLEWDESGEQARRIRMVRLRDGGTVWSRDRPGAVSWAIDTTPGVRADRLLTFTAQGRAEVIALADGSVVTAGTLPRPRATQTDAYAAVSLQGRQFYQHQMVRGRTRITAYDTATLRQLWIVEQPSEGWLGCGPVVCVSQGKSIFGYDRVTGARLWQLAETSAVYPLPDGRLLAQQEHSARLTVVDGTTGRRLAEVGRGLPVWDGQGRLTYLIAGTLQPPGRTSVSSFGPASAESVLRGTVAPAQTCRSERDLLTCVTEDSRLAVTAVG